METAPSREMEALQAPGLPAAELDVRVTSERSEERNLKAFQKLSRCNLDKAFCNPYFAVMLSIARLSPLLEG